MDAMCPNPMWTFCAPTQHCVVFILVKETLQTMMAYDDDC